jgi:hypothetical protein
MNNLSRRLVAVAAVLVAVGVASLVGGVRAGHAATAFTITLDQFVADDVNTVSQVSTGGAIGYHVFVQNTGDSNTTHVQIIVTSDSATFLDANDPNCAAAGGNQNQMVCVPLGGTMNPGDTYSVDFRFSAPKSAGTVHTTAAVVIAAQSVGGKNHGTNGTTIVQDPPPPSLGLPTTVVADTSLDNTFLRGHGNASAGGPQNFSLTLPQGLLGNPFAIAVGIHNQAGGSFCGTCLSTFTTLTIPTASLVGVGTPFGTTNPYTWNMSAPYPSGFKLHFVWHQDDNGNFVQVPSCASLVGNAPTADDPLCWDSLQQLSNKKIVQATGRGLENGNGGFG